MTPRNAASGVRVESERRPGRGAAVLRRSILALSRSETLKQLAATMPVTSDIVARFVPGESTGDAVGAAKALAAENLFATMDYLGEDTTDRARAEVTVGAYTDLIDGLSAVGLSERVEVSVKLSAVGQALTSDGERIALDNARQICQAARDASTTVTIDMEDHTTTDSTLSIVSQLRAEFPDTGAVLQAYLHRTEQDCRDLATAGSRVRLCKGAYN